MDKNEDLSALVFIVMTSAGMNIALSNEASGVPALFMLIFVLFLFGLFYRRAIK